MRIIRGLAATVGLAVIALCGSAGPSLAECVSQVNRFPDYADVAPTARTVVIGTVVETRPNAEEASGLFRLRIDDVIRGDPPATLDIEALRSGLARRGESACRNDAFLHARTGDVIALALDGRLDGRRNIHTAVWIEGRPSEWDPGIRVMSRERAIAAATALPATDTLPTEPSPAQAGDDTTWLVLLSLATLGAYWRLRSSRRREG